MASQIEDYALIGDCQTAALVARDGSIDWLCFPRFDSGACFAALLGTPEHGRWLLTPTGEIRRVTRRYHEGTLILATEYATDAGAVTVIDWMPIRTATPDMFRMVVCKRGQVRNAHGADRPLRLWLDRSVGAAHRRAGSGLLLGRTRCTAVPMCRYTARICGRWPSSRSLPGSV